MDKYRWHKMDIGYKGSPRTYYLCYTGESDEPKGMVVDKKDGKFSAFIYDHFTKKEDFIGDYNNLTTAEYNVEAALNIDV
jgi:hypothetical protein